MNWRPWILEAEVDGVKFCVITVHYAGGEVAGFAEVRLQGLCAQLRGMFVVPSARRAGAGTVLYQAALLAAGRHQMHSLAFTVRQTNLVALQFYRKLGAVAFFATDEDWWLASVLSASASASAASEEGKR